MLQRNSSQKEPAGSWSEDKDQCKNSQGPEKDRSKQEEISIKLNETKTVNHVTCFKNRNNRIQEMKKVG